MKKFSASLITAAATLALACPLYAAGEYKTQDQTQQSGQIEKSDQMDQSGQLGQSGQLDQSGLMADRTPSADELQGMKVISQQGEEIGEISDVKTDPQTGQVSHVTVSKGGILGIGSEESPVPLEAFSFSAESDRATLTVDESKLDNAPLQAEMSDQEFNRELQSHYGISPAWQQEQDQQLRPSEMTPGMDESTSPRQDSPSDMQLDDSSKQQQKSPGSY